MYERMLDKQIKPSLEAMADYCGENGERFILLNQWLGKTFETEQQIVFPYGTSMDGAWRTGRSGSFCAMCLRRTTDSL